MALKITREVKKYNPKIVVYGEEGVGKSTFAALAPKPVFMGLEGGTELLEPSPFKIGNLETWNDVYNAVTDLINNPYDYKTLVIDSLTSLEQLAHKQIIGNSKLDITRINGGYGSGLRSSEKMHTDFGERLNILRTKKDMIILLIAHYTKTEVKDPMLAQPYVTYSMNMHKYISSFWKVWSDAVLFCQFDTQIKESESTEVVRATTNNSRHMYTTRSPAYDAKNRFGFPSCVPLTEQTWDTLNPYLKKGIGGRSKEEVIEEISHLIKNDNFDPVIREKVQVILDDPESSLIKLETTENKIKTLIK